MTVLLALDSSTESMALALCGPQGVRLFEGAGGAQASSRLLPELQRLLGEAGLGWDSVDAVAFGRGPGAFTGLRTACAVAQGLAFGIGRPVLALDSLMLVAEDARQQAGDGLAPGVVWVLMDARMGEVYAGAYTHDGRFWATSREPALYTLPALLAELAALAVPPVALCGSALSAFAELGALTLAPQWPHSRSRAAALAVLAEQAWAQGRAQDPAEAMPVYVRDKVAQTSAERAAIAAGHAPA